MFVDLVGQLREAVASTPQVLQWLVVMLAGALPFVESYYGSVIGVAAGVAPLIAIPAAICGNVTSTLGCIVGVSRLRNPFWDSELKKSRKVSARRERLRRRFDRFGVVGVSLTSQAILPSQLSSMIMIGFGASPRRVAIWQSISICLWGVAYGSLAAFGFSVVQ